MSLVFKDTISDNVLAKATIKKAENETIIL